MRPLSAPRQVLTRPSFGPSAALTFLVLLGACSPDGSGTDAADVGGDGDSATDAEVAIEDARHDPLDGETPDTDAADATGDGAPDGDTAPERLVDLVDPFIGTGGIYVTVPNCFPGAVAPFGMIAPSPDTTSPSGALWYAHAAGYHYDDTLLLGFSHNRLQGVSTPDLGAVLLLPWLGGEARSLADPAARRPAFSHDDEAASPGYYRLEYDGGRVRAELTATPRTAHHRYAYAGGGRRHVVLDLGHAPERTTVEATSMELSDDRALVTGWVATRGRFTSRAPDFRTYFALRLRPSPDEVLELDDGAVLTWNEADTVEAQVAISYVDVDGALANLAAEAPEFDFDGTRQRAADAWEEMLSHVRFDGGTDEERRVMATALYHSLVMPSRMADADGRYRGLDAAVHDDPEFTYFSNFSLWDTYRTVHPLLALAWPDAQLDMVRSLVLMAEQGGHLPRWPMTFAYTNTTVGSPADIVVAEAWLKGLTDFDAASALDHMLRIADAPPEAGHPYAGRPAVEQYRALGYVPADIAGASVSATLEVSIADGAISRLAAGLGRDEVATEFQRRAANYRNLWDPALRVFRPRNQDGSFVDGFDRNEYESTGAYYGGNAVQHAWLVPHDLPGLFALFDTTEAAVSDLQGLFEGERADRALLGPLAGLSPPRWYYHGNEPDLHAAWVFALLGRPDLAQFWSDWAADEYYAATPEGIPGNEDMGALSAWYVWSALGIYPVPASDVYLVGRPAFEHMEVDVARGTLVIEAPGAGAATYVAGLALDGVPIDRPWLRHDELADGGTLRFTMSSEPTTWGTVSSEPFPAGLPDPLPDPPPAPHPHLVLVHGYLGRGADWDTAVDGMVDRGWDRDRIHAPTLGDTNDSVIELAERLDAAIEAIIADDPAARLDIVGHSLGGPVVRWWVSQLGGWERAEHVVTIAGANHGNDAACLTTWLGASSEQLCPAWASERDSADRVQWRLNGDPNVVDVDETPHGTEDGGHIRWTAIAFTSDLIVVPWQVQCLDSAVERDCDAPVNHVVSWSGAEHISLIRDPRFLDLLADRLRR